LFWLNILLSAGLTAFVIAASPVCLVFWRCAIDSLMMLCAMTLFWARWAAVRMSRKGTRFSPGGDAGNLATFLA